MSKTAICCTLVFVIALVILYNSYHIQNALGLAIRGSYWSHYRLGDAVGAWRKHVHNTKLDDWLESRRQWRQIYKHDFPESLAFQYLSQTNDRQLFSIPPPHWDVKYLAAIAAANQRPDDKTLVVHLRMGDELDDISDIDAFWKSGSFGHKVESRSSTRWRPGWGRALGQVAPAMHRAQFESVLTKRRMASIPVTRAVLVGSSVHMPHSLTNRNTKTYVALLSQWLTTNYNFTVTWRGDHHAPDDDFGYMSLARYFVRSGGSFSHLVSKVVVANGGMVLNGAGFEG